MKIQTHHRLDDRIRSAVFDRKAGTAGSLVSSILDAALPQHPRRPIDFIRDDLVAAMASSIRAIVDTDHVVAWVQPYGWTTEKGSKIANTAEQHSADEVAEIAGGWHLVFDLGDVAVFRISAGEGGSDAQA